VKTPVAHIANVMPLQDIFTATITPAWRATLWLRPYERNLPFMAASDPQYNDRSRGLQSLIVDFVEYLEVDSLATLRANPMTWMMDGAVLLVHFQWSHPPAGFVNFRNGVAWAFSRGRPVMLGTHKTYPLIISVPTVEDKSDHFTYARMRFASGKLKVDNSQGQFGDLLELFGNDVTLLLADDTRAEAIRSFFIEKYDIGLTNVAFSVKDKRSRLTAKAPNTFYHEADYPHMDENLCESVAQDAYGYCIGVPGTWLNSRQVYNAPGFMPADGFNDRMRAKFARTITRIETVHVEMNGIWVEVFPGLGVRGQHDSQPAQLLQRDEPEPHTRHLAKRGGRGDLHDGDHGEHEQSARERRRDRRVVEPSPARQPRLSRKAKRRGAAKNKNPRPKGRGILRFLFQNQSNNDGCVSFVVLRSCL